MADLGVGPQCIPRKKLTGQPLEEAITAAVSNVEMRQRASDLGQHIRAEDGVGEAVAVIDQFCQQRRPLGLANAR